MIEIKSWIFLSLGFILGAILGSFVKAVADRSLANKSFKGRSYCESCKHKLSWYDLLPIVSYLTLKGRCRYCRKRIALEYLLIEILTGLLVATIFLYSPFNFSQPFDIYKWVIFVFDLIFKTFFITILVVVLITDLKKMLIPDRVILPATVIGFLALLALMVFKIWYLYYYLNLTPLGRLLLPPHNEYFQRHALIIAQDFGFSLLMGFAIGAFFTLLIIITRGRGMGGGDVKLGAFIGLVLGFPNGLVALMTAFLSGAVMSLILIAAGKKHFGQSIPFGPFLVLGSIVALFWGSQIYNWYLFLNS